MKKTGLFTKIGKIARLLCLATVLAVTLGACTDLNGEKKKIDEAENQPDIENDFFTIKDGGSAHIMSLTLDPTELDITDIKVISGEENINAYYDRKLYCLVDRNDKSHFIVKWYNSWTNKEEIYECMKSLYGGPGDHAAKNQSILNYLYNTKEIVSAEEAEKLNLQIYKITDFTELPDWEYPFWKDYITVDFEAYKNSVNYCKKLLNNWKTSAGDTIIFNEDGTGSAYCKKNNKNIEFLWATKKVNGKYKLKIYNHIKVDTVYSVTYKCHNEENYDDYWFETNEETLESFDYSIDSKEYFEISVSNTELKLPEEITRIFDIASKLKKQ